MSGTRGHFGPAEMDSWSCDGLSAVWHHLLLLHFRPAYSALSAGSIQVLALHKNVRSVPVGQI